MTRLLAIPVGGTLAALLAIFIFHKEREVTADAGPSLDEPPPFEVTAPDDVEDEPEDEPWDEETAPPPPPPPQPRTYRLQLRADGVLVDRERATTYANAEEFLEAIGEDARVRHSVVLGNDAPEVAEEAVDAVLKALAPHCDVRKVYRGAPKDEERGG